MKWIQRKPKVAYSSRDSTLDKIAKIRGISDINRFLNPTQDELHNPYLMKNIEEASNRIIKAIGSNERICLSYDADADGLTATSTMFRYLKNYTDNVYYIYSERNDGHGIQNQIDQIEEGTDLLIIIDSSSNETETCKKIRGMGIDVIILDHHAIERHNPYVLMVNPQQKDCRYPNKHISGAGVVFKTIQVMEDTLEQVDPFQYIDLVAVGMYADVMRVDVPENRFIIMHGLRNMRNTGLLRILKSAKVDMYKMNSSVIGFTIAPLLNGVARLDNIKLAIDMLTSDDDKECQKIYRQMKKLNEERKERQKEIVEQYMKSIDVSKKVLIVLDEQSSKGFNGLIAQELSEKYKRPVIVGRSHQGTIAGSFRSCGGFDFKRFLSESGLVDEAMGHPQAGGVSLQESKLEELVQYIENNLPELKQKEQTIIYDLEISVDEVMDYINEVEKFNLLHGNSFPKVIVKVNGITVEEVNIIGRNEDTCKIRTFDDVELIKFRVSEEYGQELGYFDTINVVGQLQWNEWYNYATRQKISTPQIILEDYRVDK